ncbi:hypothetical protein H5410_051931 [Solanum commersonii]|uniref:Uncharacterized protein n=1 Tax=Solanum commersonii TaxID=4109 RepID=A0A9J5X2I9_SOLCO|nr:hypothetical protein H5410_051931 [Solanum commersonii]
MIIPEDIGQQEEICKMEIPSFYANKIIIGISTIIQELANNYLNGNAIWSYYTSSWNKTEDDEEIKIKIKEDKDDGKRKRKHKSVLSHTKPKADM